MNLDILKCHGTGNDFILIDEMDDKYNLDDNSRSFLAEKLCDRETGIGGDGILYVLDGDSEDARMRIFNSDGSEAEMCANGLRCVGRYVIEKLSKDKIVVETMVQNYDIEKIENFYGDMTGYKITLENVLTPYHENIKEFDNIYMGENFEYITVSNPHAISLTSKDVIFSDLIKEMGKTANDRRDIFDSGINLSLVAKINDDSIYVRTYERGVGMTKSCGTGMIASTTSYSKKNNLLNQWINVFNDGGVIKCIVNRKDDNSYSAVMIGNASYIFKAKVEVDMDNGEYKVSNKELLNNEVKEYEDFFNSTRDVLNNIK